MEGRDAMNTWDIPTWAELWDDAARTFWSILYWFWRLCFSQKWYIDEEHGSDGLSSSGRSREQALRTHDELMRRLPREIQRPYAIYILSDMTLPLSVVGKEFFQWGGLRYIGAKRHPVVFDDGRRLW
jgi:hypothetical protein